MTVPPAVEAVDLSGHGGSGLELAAATSIGPVRAENQDAFGAVATPEGGLAALVADGMGGHAGGREAALAAQEAALSSLAAGGRPGDAVERANQAVAELRRRVGGHPGTTLTLVVLRDGAAELAHAGDSRAYLVRDGTATCLTVDHSWVGEQVRAGALPPGSERRHPRRNVITQAVMGDAMEPQLDRVVLQPRDVLLLCSDGFWEPLQDEDIAALAGAPGPLLAVVQRSCQAALDAGATDNVTLLAVRVPPADG